MTAILERVPVDRISHEARQIRPGRAVLTVIAALFYALGWLAAKLVTGTLLAVTWSAAAVKVGWQEGRGSAVSRGAA